MKQNLKQLRTVHGRIVRLMQDQLKWAIEAGRILHELKAEVKEQGGKWEDWLLENVIGPGFSRSTVGHYMKFFTEREKLEILNIRKIGEALAVVYNASKKDESTSESNTNSSGGAVSTSDQTESSEGVDNPTTESGEGETDIDDHTQPPEIPPAPSQEADPPSKTSVWQMELSNKRIQDIQHWGRKLAESMVGLTFEEAVCEGLLFACEHRAEIKPKLKKGGN